MPKLEGFRTTWAKGTPGLIVIDGRVAVDDCRKVDFRLRIQEEKLVGAVMAALVDFRLRIQEEKLVGAVMAALGESAATIAWGEGWVSTADGFADLQITRERLANPKKEAEHSDA